MASFKKEGEAAALSSLAGVQGRVLVGMRQGAHMAGQLLVRTTHSGMQSAGGGRLHHGARRPAGAPGGYPAIQRGQLIGSIAYEATSDKLEFGSRGAFNRGYDYAIGQNEGNSRVAARPYLDLTIAKTQAQVTAVLGETVWRKIVGG